MKVSRIVATAATLSAAMCALAIPSALASPHAVPSAAPHAGATEYFDISIGGTPQSVIAHGAFVASGTDVAGDGSDVLHLGGGRLTIFHPDDQSRFTVNVNPKTCFATVTVTGTYTYGHGTGRYRGFTGSGTYTVKEQAVLPRTKSGACSQSAQPTTEVGQIRASGPVTS